MGLTKWIILIELFLLVLIMMTRQNHVLIEGVQQPQVPCLFFLGDSLFDNGNNNNLLSLAKVNFKPYGIDYPGGQPTGRFTNGRNIPDFLAEYLGFEDPIPPYAIAQGMGNEILKGVNYASGAAGIQDISGYRVGGRYSMNTQLLQHAYIVSRIEFLIGNAIEAKDHLNKCLYISNIGNDDYLDNYLVPDYYISSKLYTPEQYAEMLIQEYTKQLMTLYSYGARKIAVLGIGLLGCVPEIIYSNSNGSSCVESVNSVFKPFNTRLASLVEQLNTNMPDTQFTFLDFSTSLSYGVYSLKGIKVVNEPCCMTGNVTGLCDRDSVPCSNRNEYAFWDNYHPSQVVCEAAAKRMFNAASPAEAYPMDISQLAKK